MMDAGDELGKDVMAALEDELQPPMANGEVLFDQPWQGRVFGMAVALHEAGMFAWSEFQDRLIAVIETWDRNDDGVDPYAYYDHFAQALDDLMVEKGVLSAADLQARVTAFADRPHGHDHDH